LGKKTRREMKNSVSVHRETVLAIVVGLSLLFLLFRKDWLIYSGAFVGLVGLLSSFLAGIIHRGWMKLTRFIGFINAHLLLGLIFFAVLWPIAFLSRLRGKDHLNLRRGKVSYFRERNHRYEAKDLENPW
jgi:hypothetical protein